MNIPLYTHGSMLDIVLNESTSYDPHCLGNGEARVICFCESQQGLPQKQGTFPETNVDDKNS